MLDTVDIFRETMVNMFQVNIKQFLMFWSGVRYESVAGPPLPESKKGPESPTLDGLKLKLHRFSIKPMEEVQKTLGDAQIHMNNSK